MSDMLRLVEPLIPALRRYARSLLKDRASADDLVQDCLERAITRWHSRRADGDAKTWVFTILHNLAVNELRQRARRGPHIRIEKIDEAAAAVAPLQEDVIRRIELEKALDGLPADQRSVLLLVSIENLSYAETAKVLGIPIGTVMSRLARARQNLLERLGDEVLPGQVTRIRRVK